MNNRAGMITFWVSIAIIAASIEPIVVKLGYRASATPMQLLVAKNLVGALLIVPITRTWRWIGWSALAKVMAVSVLLLTTNSLTLMALKNLSAVTVITILTTAPALVALFNQQLGRDVLGTKFWIGFGMCFCGVLLGLGIKDLSFSVLGLLQICGAVLSSTIYRVRMEDTTRELQPALVSTYMFLINGIFTLLFFAPWVGPIPAHGWVLGAWIGLAALAGNVAFVYALSLLGSTRVSIINMLQRPIIIIAAALILKESLTAPKMLGVVLVLIGVQFARVARRKAVQDLGDISEEDYREAPEPDAYLPKVHTVHHPIDGTACGAVKHQ